MMPSLFVSDTTSFLYSFTVRYNTPSHTEDEKVKAALKVEIISTHCQFLSKFHWFPVFEFFVR